MEKLSALWDRVEKIAIYLVLTLFFMLELVSYLVPSFTSWVDTRGAFILIALTLLLVFRYVDGRIDKRDALTVCEGRQQAVSDALGEKEQHASMDLFTHSSSVSRRAFIDSKARVRNVRILLRDFQTLDNVQFPHTDKDKKDIRSQSRLMVAEWTRLKQEGMIESLEIKYYQFEPMGHFMILDKKTLYFGLYTWEKKSPGVGSRKHEAYIADGRTVTGRAMIDDFQLRFDDLWEQAR